MKIFKLLLLLFSILPSSLLSDSVVGWSGGNKLKIYFLSSPDLENRAEEYLLVKPEVEIPGYEISFLPFLKVKIKLYRKNERIYKADMLPAFTGMDGLIYYASVGKEYMDSAENIAIIIGPDRGIVKDGIEDEGTILDTTYQVTLYHITVSGTTVLWRNHSIERVEGIFYPWDFHEEILEVVNVIVQSESDKGELLQNDIDLIRKRYPYSGGDETKLISLASKYVKNGENTAAKMIMKSLGFYAIRRITFSPVSTYEDVEKIWVWGKSFYDLLGSCGKADVWDAKLYEARIEALLGEEPLSKVLGAQGLILGCVGGRYYKDVTSDTSELIDEAIGLFYFFKPIAEEISFDTYDWENSFNNFSPSATEPVYYLFSFWRSAISYYMDKIERGESYFVDFLTSLVDLAGSWIFDRLGGDAFTTFINDFNIWKSAVLSENYSVARDARLDLLEIMDQLSLTEGG